MVQNSQGTSENDRDLTTKLLNFNLVDFDNCNFGDEIDESDKAVESYGVSATMQQNHFNTQSETYTNFILERDLYMSEHKEGQIEKPYSSYKAKEVKRGKLFAINRKEIGDS